MTFSSSFRPAVLTLLALLPLGALPTTAVAQAPASELHFIGDTLDAWRAKQGDWMVVGSAAMGGEGDRSLVTTSGRDTIVNGPTGKTNNLLTNFEHGDVIAHIEFLVPKGSNSGVYFQGRYEIQVLDSFGVKEPGYGDCGGIYQQGSKTADNKTGVAPRVNASRKPGEWQAFDVIFRAPRFDAEGRKTAPARFVKVTHNGTVIHENVDVAGPTRAATYKDEKELGPLMLQGDHGPVAYRNIRLTPTKLD